MIDEKKCYFFGRNRELCDFTSESSPSIRMPPRRCYCRLVDHASCSRVHAALLWHKDLNRPFLIDLGSCNDSMSIFILHSSDVCVLAHGTFIGHIRLEDHKAQQVHIDSEIHFGESSRIYIIRERPQIQGNKFHHIFGSGIHAGGSNTDANGDHHDDGREGNSSFAIPESEVELDVSCPGLEITNPSLFEELNGIQHCS